MVIKRDKHRDPVIRAFVALPGETLAEVAARRLPGSGFCVSASGNKNATNKMESDNSFEFLNTYRSSEEEIVLLSGRKVSVAKYFLKFKEWKGRPIPNTYGNKAVIDFNGEPVFAELAVLRLFQSHGWDGAWVDSYRRKFRIGLPDVIDPVDLPTDKKNLIDSIKQKTSASGGCWDVFVWKDNKILFIELKRSKKDKIQNSQKIWLEESLNYGLDLDNFILIEWDIR